MKIVFKKGRRNGNTTFRYANLSNGKVSFWKKSTGNGKPWKLFYSYKANGKAKRRNSRYFTGLYEFRNRDKMKEALSKMLSLWNTNPVFITKESRYRLRDYSSRVRAERRESHEAFIDRYEDREGFVSNFIGEEGPKTRSKKSRKSSSILDISELTNSQKRKLYNKLGKAFTTEKEEVDEDTFDLKEGTVFPF